MILKCFNWIYWKNINVPNIFVSISSKRTRSCHAWEETINNLKSKGIPEALRPRKEKSSSNISPPYFSDSKVVRTVGGKGGDGSVSFLRLWCNEKAGPDGGDGGNGSHIIFQASTNVCNLNHIPSIIHGDEGQPGRSKNCNGKNAKHNVVKVPVGTIVRTKEDVIVADLNKENYMFIAARGGSGGKGNCFFTTDIENSPKICEYGQNGEDLTYKIELRALADIGIIGYPNAGKSTLLNALTRARPKIAPYAFTTLHPYIGIVQYADYTQLAVADLPGIIPDSHRNKGLGLQFLQHVKRCCTLIVLIDASYFAPWEHYENIIYELKQFDESLLSYPRIVVANKMDTEDAIENIVELSNRIDEPIINISAKRGTNLEELLRVMRYYFEKNKKI